MSVAAANCQSSVDVVNSFASLHHLADICSEADEVEVREKRAISKRIVLQLKTDDTSKTDLAHLLYADMQKIWEQNETDSCCRRY